MDRDKTADKDKHDGTLNRVIGTEINQSYENKSKMSTSKSPKKYDIRIAGPSQ